MRKPPIFNGHGLAKGSGIKSLVRWKEESVQTDFERTKQWACILRDAIITSFLLLGMCSGKENVLE